MNLVMMILLIAVAVECLVLLVLALARRLTKRFFAIVASISAAVCLLVLLVSEYIGIRLEFAREDKATEEAPVRVRPSEARAERERREQVHAKWGSGAHARHETHDGEDGEDLARGR